MSHILDLLDGTVEPSPDRISLQRYVVEDTYITRYLSRVVKDKALAVYHVLFYLSWYETGKGEIAVPWATIGGNIRSEQGNIIDNSTTVKRRLPDLFAHKCISVNRQRSAANEISVHLPSDIPACRKLIDADSLAPPVEAPDLRDFYTDPQRRIHILERDGRKCVYCLLELSEDTFVLDHLVPIARGGTNQQFNLVASCQACNGRKTDDDPISILLVNYRSQLVSQGEFHSQRAYLEKLLNDPKAG